MMFTQLRLYQIIIIILLVSVIYSMTIGYLVIKNIRYKTDVIINSIYERDLTGHIELDNKTIQYLQEIDNY